MICPYRTAAKFGRSPRTFGSHEESAFRKPGVGATPSRSHRGKRIDEGRVAQIRRCSSDSATPPRTIF
ncbi:hypothetical protein WJ07_25350 [Burkholderia vietnamiensis]|nr:hypothetical protein WJ07_25350 [Burkholderia vietnamiensis]CAG9212869.1 hypothetical protein BVI434_2710012 [Burkholderia vietnamiensis]